jgi:hypothetical protein
VKNYPLFLSEIKPIRDKYESDFEQILCRGIDTKDLAQLISESEKCFEMEKEYMDRINDMGLSW